MAEVNPIVRSLAGKVFGMELMKGSYSEAAAHFQSAAALSPSHVVHRADLARALYKAGDVKSAIPAMELSLSMHAEDIHALQAKDSIQQLLDQLKKSPNYNSYWAPA
eukprot:gene21568-28562_t